MTSFCNHEWLVVPGFQGFDANDKWQAHGRYNFCIKCKAKAPYDYQKILNKVEKSTKDYPHRCPKCNSPAYIGFNQVDCKNKCK